MGDGRILQNCLLVVLPGRWDFLEWRHPVFDIDLQQPPTANSSENHVNPQIENFSVLLLTSNST